MVIGGELRLFEIWVDACAESNFVHNDQMLLTNLPSAIWLIQVWYLPDEVKNIIVPTLVITLYALFFVKWLNIWNVLLTLMKPFQISTLKKENRTHTHLHNAPASFSEISQSTSYTNIYFWKAVMEVM